MSLYIELIIVAVSIVKGFILRTIQLKSVLDCEDKLLVDIGSFNAFQENFLENAYFQCLQGCTFSEQSVLILLTIWYRDLNTNILTSCMTFLFANLLNFYAWFTKNINIA